MPESVHAAFAADWIVQMTPLKKPDSPRRVSKRRAPTEHFDSASNLANVHIPTVEALYGVSRATVWRWVAAGRIPAPRKIGPATTVWNVGELRADLAAKAGK